MDLPVCDLLGSSDPFVVISLESLFGSVSTEISKTTVKKSSLNPVWDETFSFPLLHLHNKLKLDMFDWVIR